MNDVPENLRDPMKVLERGRQIEESGGLRLEQRPSFEPCYCAKCEGKLPAPCRYGTGSRTSNSLLDSLRSRHNLSMRWSRAHTEALFNEIGKLQKAAAFSVSELETFEPTNAGDKWLKTLLLAVLRGQIDPDGNVTAQPPSDAHPDTLLLNAFPGVREELQHVLRNRTTLTKGASDAG